jgi:hypothetical protein
LTSFDDFKGNALITDADFQDYQSTYIELYNEQKKLVDGDKESIIEDVVFEIELVKQIEINVDFILILVGDLLKSSGDQNKEIKAKKEAAKAPPATAKQEDKQDLQTTFEDFTRRQQSNPERDIFAEMIARNAQQREDMKKSSAEDKNLALLAAGLGIMGGTSPYAFANIGQGAMKGVDYLGGSKAKRAAELNALNKADTEATYYGAETSRKNQTLRSLESERAIDNLAAYDAKLRKNYFMEGVAPTPKQLEAYENARRNDPIYNRLSRDAGVYGTQAPQKRTINFSTIR